MNTKKCLSIIILFIALSVTAHSQVVSKTQLHEVGVLGDGTAYVMFTGGYMCMLSISPDYVTSFVFDEYIGVSEMKMTYTFSYGASESKGEISVLPSTSGFTAFIPKDDIFDFVMDLKHYSNLTISIVKENGTPIFAPFPLEDFNNLLLYLGM